MIFVASVVAWVLIGSVDGACAATPSIAEVEAKASPGELRAGEIEAEVDEPTADRARVEAAPVQAEEAARAATAASGLAVPPGASVGAGATASARAGLRRSGGFVIVAPTGLEVGTGFDSETPIKYVWGLDGGWHFAVGRRFAGQVGAYLEHGPLLAKHEVRFGPLIRLGGGNERVFGYGLIRLGGVVVDRRRPSSDCLDSRSCAESFEPSTTVRFRPSIGAGVQGMLHRVVGLGGEIAVDYDDVELLLSRARLFLLIKF